MLKLIFYTKDLRLKVRIASANENLVTCGIWNNKIEFGVAESGDFMMVWTSLLPDLEPVYAEALVDLVSARYPLSPQYKTLLKECPDLCFKNTSEEWIFYGGTFNPWHHGHQACLDLLPEDKVCLILPDRNPQKDIREVNPVSEILQISVLAKIKKNQFIVPTFLMEKKKNPTVEWIEDLKKEFPEHKLSLLLGFDSFAGLKTWVRSSDLIKNLHAIYVVSRQENEHQRKAAVDYVWQKGLTNIQFLGNHPYEYMSSTELRSLVKKKGD